MLMAQHGGVFENYYHRGTVTHIICSNLTDQKVKLFLKERYEKLLAACLLSVPEYMADRLGGRTPVPIVRPEWIVDSIAAGHRVPVHSAADALQLSHHRRAGVAHHLLHMQINDYVLWRLRDQPGQQHLKSFTAQPAVRSDEAGKADAMAAVRSPDGKMMLQQGVSGLAA